MAQTKLEIHLAAAALALSTLELKDTREIETALHGGTDLTGKDYDYFKSEFTNARTKYQQLKTQPAPSTPPPVRPVAAPKPTPTPPQ